MPSGGDMFGSTRFGTFGVACAAYHFARGWRPSGLFERLAMRLGGQSRVFQLLFTDDLKMVGQAASADNYHVCLKFLWLLHGHCKFEVELPERRTDCAVGGRSPAERGLGLTGALWSVLAWMKPLQRDGPTCLERPSG